MATITQVTEKKRGCGYRKPGGLYFRHDGAATVCGKLPIELTVCPCCGEGVKFARSPQWIMGSLLAGAECKDGGECKFDCPLGNIYRGERYLLIWIGAKHYPTPADYMRESREMGLSRRIKSVPKDFVLGKTRVFLAHLHAVEGTDEETGKPVMKKGIFSSFVPSRIEYVVTGEETEEQLDALEKRGLSLVNVTPEGAVTQEELQENMEEE